MRLDKYGQLSNKVSTREQKGINCQEYLNYVGIRNLTQLLLYHDKLFCSQPKKHLAVPEKLLLHLNTDRGHVQLCDGDVLAMAHTEGTLSLRNLI